MFHFKKKKKADLETAFQNTISELKSLNDWEDPKKLEKYILDSCEEIISNTKEIQNERKEYNVVDRYLQDADKLENLDEDSSRKVSNLARRVSELDSDRIKIGNRQVRIEEKDYNLIEENEDDVIRSVKRLKENEAYQDTMEKDMQKLEAEKNTIEIDRDNLKHAEKNAGVIATLLFIVFGSALILILMMRIFTDHDISWALLLVLLALAGSLAAFVVWTSSIKRRKRSCVTYLNKIIPILNSRRMKYANITNAVNYTYNKYGVKSARELEYLYNNYQEEKKARDDYRQTNAEMEDTLQLFMNELHKLDLFDSSIWENQAKALIDEEEMAEVKNRLSSRKQLIRDQIRANTESVKLERDEIDRIMQEHNFYVPEILEIINSVDRLCGLNQYKRTAKKL